ncbi:uncharacterized protein [Spinacia oleracea]|uniref:SWIM-type domain-containing protein n=1 Tax=Spinacia oleracea TaxID=3562 RepID=A0ABM3R3X1_SPIOL|nr:uncharacterized protein LOC130465538 [Spinacia oleracea]
MEGEEDDDGDGDDGTPKASSEFLAERFMDDFRDDPKMSIETFQNHIRRHLGLEVDYYKAYYARIMALQFIHGSAAEQYGRIWDYAAAIRRYNPGSSAFVRVTNIERPPTLFQRFYCCLQPCKEGFVHGCRHILGVDGCHLRSTWPGICLVAVGKDGNNNLFPVAWGIVEAENKESWKWFLELLVKDLGSVTEHITWVHENDDLTFMSDRQKGLLDAFKTVVPNAEIRYCCRHIWANFKLAFPGEAFRLCFWKAARASTKEYFDSQMESIKMLSKDAFTYLNKIPTDRWSRHAFSTKSKSAMILNNCCESFNNVIREARSQPILSMMEWVRRYVMKRACIKREGMENYVGKVMPAAIKLLHLSKEGAKNCFETKSTPQLFEVNHGENQYVVNLQARTCGCYRWDLTGIPCCHAFRCIMRNRADPEDYVHKAYTKEAFLLAYAPVFYPMPGMKQWEKTKSPHPLPPPFRKMAGRPSKRKRIRAEGEDDEHVTALVVKRRKPTRCGNCGDFGHNKKTCKNDAAPPPPPKKMGRPKKQGPFTKHACTSKKNLADSGASASATKRKSKAAPAKGKSKAAPAKGRTRDAQGTQEPASQVDD